MLRAKVITTSDPYSFDLDQNGFLSFSKKNLRLVNALICYDSNYGPSENPDDETVYSGMLNKTGIPKTYDEILKIVISIDKINSTHLAAEGKGIEKEARNAGREKTARKIDGIENFAEKLKEGNASLVKDIALVDGVNRNNFSFATKYCAFVSLYALKKDSYCIYDRILMQILPYYAYMYLEGDEFRKFCTKKGNSTLDVQFRQPCDYNKYRKLIDRIISGIECVTGLRLQYRELDKLLWYYYKGSNRKIKEASQILAKEM